MLQEEQIDWFIEINGSLKGPYPSKQVADAAMLAEGLQGRVVSKTSDGREVLMG